MFSLRGNRSKLRKISLEGWTVARREQRQEAVWKTTGKVVSMCPIFI